MSIYLDIIFLENILMNYIILFATLVIVKSKAKHLQLRLIISSVIGSIYAIIVYLNIFKIYSNIIAKIILSIVMVYVAFGATNIKKLLKDLLVFYLVSFIFGGCTISLIYFLKPENVKMKNGVFVGTYPIKVALIAGVIAFVITQVAFKINKNKLGDVTLLNVELFLGEKSIMVKAFLDSGNLLKDPISNYPVIVVEQKELEKLIPKETLNYISKTIGGDAKLKNNTKEIEGQKQFDEKTNYYLSRIRMIPFMSLGKENGILTGIRFDMARIETDEIIKEKNNIIVGIYNKKLTKDNKYNALIGLNLLEGEEKNEFASSAKR